MQDYTQYLERTQNENARQRRNNRRNLQKVLDQLHNQHSNLNSDIVSAIFNYAHRTNYCNRAKFLYKNAIPKFTIRKFYIDFQMECKKLGLKYSSSQLGCNPGGMRPKSLYPFLNLNHTRIGNLKWGNEPLKEIVR